MIITLLIQDGTDYYGKRIMLDPSEIFKLVQKENMSLSEILGTINQTIRDMQYDAVNKLGKKLENNMKKKIGYWEDKSKRGRP